MTKKVSSRPPLWKLELRFIEQTSGMKYRQDVNLTGPDSVDNAVIPANDFANIWIANLGNNLSGFRKRAQAFQRQSQASHER